MGVGFERFVSGGDSVAVGPLDLFGSHPAPPSRATEELEPLVGADSQQAGLNPETNRARVSMADSNSRVPTGPLCDPSGPPATAVVTVSSLSDTSAIANAMGPSHQRGVTGTRDHWNYMEPQPIRIKRRKEPGASPHHLSTAE